jgi:hypothetical protein
MRYFIFLILISVTSLAQFSNIQLNKNDNAANEVSVYINPSNPDNIIAGANINNFYYSFDRGITWGEGKLSSTKYGVWGDPCLIFDKNGRAYYFHLSNPGTFDNWIDRIVCQWSDDGGKTWSEPGSYMGLNFPKKQDKEWACSDMSGKTNNIYTSWTQFDKYNSKNPGDSSIIRFSYSSDGGKSWSEALRLCEKAGDCRDSANTVEGAVPSIGPNGEVYVAWSGPLGIVFDRSTDAGRSWLANDIKVTPQIGGWENEIPGIYRCNGMPVTGCDISNGKYKGNIYINFSDIRNGEDDCDIFMVRSTDGGDTWCDPKRINDDLLKNSRHQFMSWMSVDPVTGHVFIIFYDRREYDDLNTDVYLARSTDGGDTFVNYKISESPFVPDKSVFFGDYTNINAYNDHIACVWQRMDNRIMKIMFSGIEGKQLTDLK